MLVGAVNAGSLLTEASRVGAVLDWRIPWMLELSSVLVLIALIPLVVWLERRVQMTAESWLPAVLIHLGASLGFSVLHVIGMILLRKAAFWALMGQPYVFFHNVLLDGFTSIAKTCCPMRGS